MHRCDYVPPQCRHRLRCAGIIVSAVLIVQGALAMQYVPPEPFEMWDTWVFQDGDEYHLFFLRSEPDQHWNTLGRAVSNDLVHWKRLPPIPTKGPPEAWDHNPTLTGMTVTDEENDRYALFYGSSVGAQRIGVMFSDDLKEWEKFEGNPVLQAATPHYGPGDWRDLCTFYHPQQGRWHGYVCAEKPRRQQDARPRIDTIADKTLVAWVYPLNTSQRGGGVLTLNHGAGAAEIFDAIVFGERKPGVWMAGSEMFRRTEDDQSDYPREQAGPDTLVQIAIAYSGREITIYRNGQQYCEYEIDEPVQFTSGTSVVMGLRHLQAGAGSPRFFAGAIEEARVYDEALDAQTIRELEPDANAGPEPLAKWTFEDGTAGDLMGTFPPGQLRGGAYIEDGKLHLDGKGAYMSTPAGSHRKVACIAHVTSDDLIHWDHLPPVFSSDEFVNMEVPDYFELNGWHYLLFSSGGSWKNTSGRDAASGTFYVMSEDRDGPYHLPESPLLLGSGRFRRTNYVGRTIPFGNTRLLYHHTCGGRVTWCGSKLVRQNADGTLWLQYWDGIDSLRTRALFEEVSTIETEDTAGPGDWVAPDDVVTGRSPHEPAVLWLPGQAGDAMITLRLDAQQVSRIGVVFRWDGDNGRAALLRPDQDEVEVADVRSSPASIATSTIDSIRGVTMIGGRQRLRVIVRGHVGEVYLNQRWLHSLDLSAGVSPMGRIGLFVEDGSATFTNVGVAEIEPLVAGGSVH